MTSGLSYLNFAADKVYDNTAYTAGLLKEKADQYVDTEKIKGSANNVASTVTTNLSSMSSEVSKAAKDVANDPFHSQIVSKTTENAKNAAS